MLSVDIKQNKQKPQNKTNLNGGQKTLIKGNEKLLA